MIKENLYKIIPELSSVFDRIDENKVAEIVRILNSTPKIYIAGAGRSGLMMKAFAMRLMHLGLHVYIVGDVITPGASKDDLLIVASGSGETESLKAYADKALKIGLKIITITSFTNSYLGIKSDVTLQIPAPTPKSNEISNIESDQPMGNLFEQALMICLDALIMELMELRLAKSEEMFIRHANIE